jgi:signal transduction histidine kinase
MTPSRPAGILRLVTSRRTVWLVVGGATVDALLVLLLVSGGAAQSAGAPGLTLLERATAVAACVLLPLAVLARRWLPAAAAVLVTATVVVAALVVPLEPTPAGLSFGGDGGGGHFLIAIAAVLFAVGSGLPTALSLPLAVAMLATTALPGVIGEVDGEPRDPWIHVVPALFVVGVYLASLAMRSRRLAVARVEQYAAELERSRGAESRAAVAEERLRIARELHDVIGHHISLAAIQLAAAEATFESRPAVAREAIATARASGQAALDEMRAVVGALREDPSTPAATGMSGVPGLLAALRDAGLEVSLTESGRPRPLAPIVDLAAYRIVQESLTNVLRHAGTSSADLGLEWGGGQVRITVRDDGRGPVPAEADGPAPGGHGLTGMRERVAAVRGRIAVGAAPGGGFEVDAVLPYSPVSQPSGGSN